MAETQFLTAGSQCKCQFGTAPDKIVVNTQSKDYINDEDGSKKLIASTKDIGVPFENKTFGTCSITRSSCVPAVTEWKEPYPNVKLSNKGNILTVKSKGECAVAGYPCITVVDHGQKAKAGQSHFDQVQPETLTFLNPLAPPPGRSRKIPPKIKSIKLTCTRASAPILSKNNRADKIAVFEAGIDESLQFDVQEFVSAAGDKNMTGWKVVKDHSFDGEYDEFDNAGSSFKVNFDALGKYRVIAFGSDGDAEDWHRCIDVDIIANKIVDVEFENASHHVKLETTGPYYKVRRAVPVTIKAKYLFKPVNEEDKSRISARVVDIAGNEIALSSTDSITFVPANTVATYTVKFTMQAHSEGEPEIIVQKILKSEANGVLAVTCAQGEFVRPGTTMQFEVSKLVYSTLVETAPVELSAIKWQLNGRDVGMGGKITLDGSYFTNLGSYVVEAYVEIANAYKIKNGIQTGKHEKDDWQFQVKHNEIKTLEGPKEWIIGKKYSVIATTQMEYNKQLDGQIQWAPKDIDSTPLTCEDVYATGVGNFRVTATLGSSKKEFSAKATLANITRWCFTDAGNVYKPKAGWSETLNALITCKEAAGESVNIHLLEYDGANDSNYIKDLGNATFDSNGEAKISFNTNDIKAALNELWFEERNSGYYDLYFGILKKEAGLQFADMKIKKVDGKEFYFPAKENNHTGKETGKFIYINSKKEIVSVHFTDSSGYPAYKVYNYGEKINIHIQAKNMAEEEIKYEMWENKNKHEDKKIVEASYKISSNEKLNLTLDTATLKSSDTIANAFLRSFYIILKNNKVDKFLFPPKIADENAFDPKDVNFYNHIKLSEKWGDWMNGKMRSLAPVILGEELEGEKHENGDCPRCNEPVTASQLKEVFPKADESSLQEAAAAYTKYMKDLGMNTCWNKAHFFAQASIEVGLSFTLKKGENLNYSTRRLLQGDYSKDFVKGDLNTKTGGHNTTGKFHSRPFSYFDSHKEEAERYGRKDLNNNDDGLIQKANPEMIANLAYGPHSVQGRRLGNILTTDGWKFRGRGLVQLTGRGNYDLVKKYVLKEENIDIINDPEQVEKVNIAVLTSMGYWKNHQGDVKSNGERDEDVISRIIGNDVDYLGKKKSFNEVTSKIFKINDCKYGKFNETEEAGDGVLEEMKKIVDKHIPYSQSGIRNSLSVEGLKNLDCSETIGIYLNKLGVMPILKAIDTSLMTNQNNFRKAIGSDNIDFIEGSNLKDFKPQRGDVFVWRDGDGHTGIVYKYDSATDIVTILEAIGNTGAVSETDQVNNGGYAGKGCSRTAKYHRLKGALFGHRGWIGYFRPKNYTKTL